MTRNVEIKARIDSIEALLPLPIACADGPAEAIAQDDTFFRCAIGRLKLRVSADGRGELIAYERPDAAGPKTSDYAITPVADPDALRAALARALGLGGRVVKQRNLLQVGRTRVHLDRVAGLGDFMELEVVLREGESADDGVAVAHDLLRRLQIAPSQLVSGAYADLLRLKAEGDAKGTPSDCRAQPAKKPASNAALNAFASESTCSAQARAASSSGARHCALAPNSINASTLAEPLCPALRS